MKLIFVCSPLTQGDFNQNIINAKKYAKEISTEGNIPIVPHLYFTSFLNDSNQNERELGINMGLELMKYCDEMQVYNYTKHSKGMNKEIDHWKRNYDKQLRFK